MKVIDLELRRNIMRLSSQVDEKALGRELEAVAAIPQGEISRRERERLLVRKAVMRLPQNARVILFLKFWEGDTLEEIAGLLALPLEQARIEYVSALSYLEKVLKPYVLEPSFFMRGNAGAV